MRKASSRGTKQRRRQAQHPSRTATANTSVVTRQFRYTTQIAVTDANTQQGGTENFFAFNNPIGDYTGSTYITNNHEQYRVRRIKLMARPSTGLFPASGTDASIATVIDTLQFQVAQYNVTNYTEVQSFVDYDTEDPPANYAEILARPNTKIQCLKATDWTMVANFVPKTLQQPGLVTSPSVNFTSQTWLSAASLTPLLYGVRGRFSCRFNAPALSLPLRVGIDIFAIATVEMRGVRNNTCSPTALLPNFGAQPCALPQPRCDDDDEEDDDVNKSSAGMSAL